MVQRLVALSLLLVTGVVLAQPEPIAVPPRVMPTDSAGDPLPKDALARMGSLRWRHGGPVHFAGFVADGRELVTAGLDGWIRVWEVPTGRELRRWRFHDGGEIDEDDRPDVATIRSVVLSPDRRFLAASLANGRVSVWSIKGGEPRSFGTGNRQHGSNGIAFSPDGRTLATRGSDHIIRLWDLRTGKENGQLPPSDKGERGTILFYGRMGNTLAFSPDGKQLAALNTWNTEDNKGSLVLYDIEAGKELHRIEGGTRSLSGRLAFGPGVLAVAWGNRETKLYDPESGKELRQIGEPKDDVIIHAVAFSPDGKKLATRSASSSPTIELWEVATGKKLGELGELVVTENDNVFIRLAGPGSSSMTVDFSADGKRIAEATGGRLARVWKLD